MMLVLLTIQALVEQFLSGGGCPTYQMSVAIRH
jgi:hypothetical protein